MKKTSILLLSFCTLLSIFFFVFSKEPLKPNLENKQILLTPPSNPPISISSKKLANQVQQKDTTLSNVKIYSDSQLPFTFEYPKSWTKFGKEMNSIDLSGTVMSRMVSFIDTVTNSTLFIEYHFSPNGKILYEKNLSDYNSSKGAFATGGNQINVAGGKAIKSVNSIFTDGKGNKLSEPLYFLQVVILDKSKTGEVDLQFKTPMKDYSNEVAKFNQVITTFKFID